MRKLMYIVLVLTGAFIISNVVAELALLTAAENHKKHDCPHSDKAATSQQETDKGHKKHDCPAMKAKKCKKMCPDCPCKVEGAIVKVENIENGVKVLITADNPEIVKKIQEAAAKGHKHKSCKEGLSSREVLSDELGKETVCPVTKEKFKVLAETKAIDYKGKTYYFCCPDCDSKFIKEPEKYISKETTKSIK